MSTTVADPLTPPGSPPRDGTVGRAHGRPVATAQQLAAAFRARAEVIKSGHEAQTAETVAALRTKYAAPVFGRIRVWQAIEMLAQCVDPSDTSLWGTSQQLHVLQILDAMENEGTATEEFILAALLHDLGKVLLIAGEAPENVACFNRPIGIHPHGIGLDRIVLQWNHDEFAWSRLKDRVPDGLAWLIRYHSIRVPECAPYMDARDRGYFARYLRPFARYDHGTKSPLYVPQRRIDDYRPLVDRVFPEPIVI